MVNKSSTQNCRCGIDSGAIPPVDIDNFLSTINNIGFVIENFGANLLIAMQGLSNLAEKIKTEFPDEWEKLVSEK